jgi:hypothetical protein
MMRLQQGFAVREMGLRDQVARQQFHAVHVADGSFATDALGALLGTMSGVPRKPTLGSSAISDAMGQNQTSAV